MKKNKRKQKNINFDKITNKRFTVFLGVILLVFGVVFIQLFKVMIINKNEYSNKLEDLTYTKVYGTSTPRGRIYDRNYNILVDNKSLKTITYKKGKETTTEEMLDVAYKVSPHIDLNISNLTDRMKREFYLAKFSKECEKLITNKEKEQF